MKYPGLSQWPEIFWIFQLGCSRSRELHENFSDEEQKGKSEFSTDSEEMTSLEDDREDQALVAGKTNITNVLLLTAFGISTGSFQYGYNLAVLNEPYQVMKSFINETNYHQSGQYLTSQTVRLYWSAIVSVFALGGMIGACAVGWWSLTFGRKRGCLVNTVLGFLGIALMVISPTVHSYHSLLVGRLVMGVHAGLYTGLCPLYLNEISTPAIRGPLGVVHQIGTVVGLLTAQVLGFPIILGTSSLWVALLGFAAVPLLLQILVFSGCPESPRYLATVSSDTKVTRQALCRLRGTSYVEQELLRLTDDKRCVIKEKSCWELVWLREYRTDLFLAILTMMSPHLAGSIAVVFYSSMIFEKNGHSPSEAMYASSGLGVTMVVMAVLSIWLVNRAGRRFLLLLGLAIMVGSCVTIVLLNQLHEKEALIAAVIALIFGLAVGPGPIPFTVVPELFPPDVKRSALAISVSFNWLANFGVGLTFPVLLAKLDHLTFVVFAVAGSILFLVLYCLLPDTRPGKEQNITFKHEGRATRASESKEGSSSPSDGSAEISVTERLRQGFSKSAILGLYSERPRYSGESAPKSDHSEILYDQIHVGELSGRKLQRASSDGDYGQIQYPRDLSLDWATSHQPPPKPDPNHRNWSCGQNSTFITESSDTGESFGVSSLKNDEPCTGDLVLEYGSSNSGLARFKSSSTSREWSQNAAPDDARYRLAKYTHGEHFGGDIQSTHLVAEGRRHFGSDIQSTHLAAAEAHRLATHGQSINSTFYGTWTDTSCAADVIGN